MFIFTLNNRWDKELLATVQNILRESHYLTCEVQHLDLKDINVCWAMENFLMFMFYLTNKVMKHSFA